MSERFLKETENRVWKDIVNKYDKLTEKFDNSFEQSDLDKLNKFINDNWLESYDELKRSINDFNFKWNNSWFLSDIIEHKQLFKQYPELKDIKIILEKNWEWGSFSFNQVTWNPEIMIWENVVNKKSTLLHEIQHYIQKKEWFARGWDVSMFRNEIDPYGSYQKLAWETEARNVQSRLLKTPQERKLLRPAKTEDIAREKQIVKMEQWKSKLLKKTSKN